MTTQIFAPGGYRFIPGVFQYSGGAAAEPGFRIERVTFRKPVPLVQGFERVAAIIKARGRPLTRLLRLRAAVARALHRRWLSRPSTRSTSSTLAKWGIYDAATQDQSGGAQQRLPRDRPAGRALVPRLLPSRCRRKTKTPTFVVAGSGEAREGGAIYRERTVRCGETSADAMREKAVFVLGEMERRLKLLGFAWSDTTATQVYTVHDLHPFLADEIVRRGAARAGLTWHYCRPPVHGLEYEMDCRGVAVEHFVD